MLKAMHQPMTSVAVQLSGVPGQQALRQQCLESAPSCSLLLLATSLEGAPLLSWQLHGMAMP